MEEEVLRSSYQVQLTRGEMVSYHTAEVLRQAEGANVVRGGWVGGDAWFGSIESCIELKKHLGLYSLSLSSRMFNTSQ